MLDTWVQGNTGPDLVARLHDLDDTTRALDLSTAASLKFQMRKPDDRRFTVNAAAAVVNASTGRVKYSWAANDLAVPGDYDVQFEVTWDDGVIQTQALPGRITVRRQ